MLETPKGCGGGNPWAIMRKQKIFSGASEKEVTGNIVKWVADDPSILILNKTIRPKTSFGAMQPGQQLVGSGDWKQSSNTRNYPPMYNDRQVGRLAERIFA